MTRADLVGLSVALTLALSACAQPEVAPGPGPDPELGVAPTVSEVEPSPVTSPSPSATAPSPLAGDTDTSPAEPTSEPTASQPDEPPASLPATPSPTAAPSASPRPAPPATTEPVVLLAVTDAAGDHGARGPDWADLRSLELVEVGNDLRVTLRFGGDLPAAPPEGEVPLIGVDIGDEGYQLFVEGGGQSWAAHLDTPDGFVEYPGTFELGGSAMVLQVPFNAVGSPTRAPVRAFVEWSRDSGTLGVLNPTSEDTLDGQPHTFDRNP